MSKRWVWAAVVWVAVFVLTALTPLLADDFPNRAGSIGSARWHRGSSRRGRPLLEYRTFGRISSV